MSAISLRALHECAVGHTYFLSSDTIATESTEVKASPIPREQIKTQSFKSGCKGTIKFVYIQENNSFLLFS